MNKAVFLDRDGTLVIDIPFNTDPALMRLEDRAIEGLQLLQAHGFRLIVVSNQPGIACGYFNIKELELMNKALQHILSKHGVYLDAVYYCPHYPDGSVSPYARPCFCRKPAPGLVFRAANAYNIDLEHSWMIGDILNDVEAGNKAGCKTILIDNGNETEWLMNNWRQPQYISANLEEAANKIILSMKAHAQLEGL
jgi:D,D-heptose 1,7-bisphosphate phosphatase